MVGPASQRLRQVFHAGDHVAIDGHHLVKPVARHGHGTWTQKGWGCTQYNYTHTPIYIYTNAYIHMYIYIYTHINLPRMFDVHKTTQYINIRKHTVHQYRSICNLNQRNSQLHIHHRFEGWFYVFHQPTQFSGVEPSYMCKGLFSRYSSWRPRGSSFPL